MADLLLQVKDVSKTFPGVKALDHVNLQIGYGEVHGLIGENGAGKSTIIKIIAGIYEPSWARPVSTKAYASRSRAASA